jgi:catechol 2,3-dioxygenase-like lactoylglutathione lyase family enzyme
MADRRSGDNQIIRVLAFHLVRRRIARGKGTAVMNPNDSSALGRSRVIAFVSTREPGRAKSFYAEKLGLRFVSEDPFAVVFDAGGTMLRVSIVPRMTPADHTVLGWDVADIEAAVVDLTARGIQFERYDALAQDGRGIWASPHGNRVAWFKDPDGNLLSLTQFAEKQS